MDNFSCERCDSRRFFVAREPGLLRVTSTSCGEEYYTVIHANVYPWPEPKEDANT